MNRSFDNFIVNHPPPDDGHPQWVPRSMMLPAPAAPQQTCKFFFQIINHNIFVHWQILGQGAPPPPPTRGLKFVYFYVVSTQKLGK